MSLSSWPVELLDEKVEEDRCLLFSLSRLLDLLLLPSLLELLSRLLDLLRLLLHLDDDDLCRLLSSLSFSTLAFSIIISSESLLLQLPIVSSSFSSPPSL